VHHLQLFTSSFNARRENKTAFVLFPDRSPQPLRSTSGQH
jgi:hypothetical protein